MTPSGCAQPGAVRPGMRGDGALDDEGFDEQHPTTVPAKVFMGWTEEQRAELALQLLLTVSSSTLSSVTSRLLPQLQRDFVSMLPAELAIHILSFTDVRTLGRAAQVSRRWRAVAVDNKVWKTTYFRNGWSVNEAYLDSLVAARPLAVPTPGLAAASVLSQGIAMSASASAAAAAAAAAAGEETPDTLMPVMASRIAGLDLGGGGAEHAASGAGAGGSLGQSVPGAPSADPVARPSVAASAASSSSMSLASGSSTPPVDIPAQAGGPSSTSSAMFHSAHHPLSQSQPGMAHRPPRPAAARADPGGFDDESIGLGDVVSPVMQHAALAGVGGSGSSSTGNGGSGATTAAAAAGSEQAAAPTHAPWLSASAPTAPAMFHLDLQMNPLAPVLESTPHGGFPLALPAHPAMRTGPDTVTFGTPLSPMSPFSARQEPPHHHQHRQHHQRQSPSQSSRSSWIAATTDRYVHLDWKHIYHQRWLLEKNWREGNYVVRDITGHAEAIYCIQFDEDKIVSGSRDDTIKVWDIKTGQCRQTLRGHNASVLCLQYNQTMLVSGSSDASIIVWDLLRGTVVRKLTGHAESVLNLRFDESMIVSCSKDKTIKIWNTQTGSLLRTLRGHRAAVNAVQYRNGLIVSASGDRTIKVWQAESGALLRTLSGHTRGIACVLFDGTLIVSGSSDKTIKIWDAHTGQQLNTLSGHTDLVRTLQFDSARILSGSYDGTIKIWDTRTGVLVRELMGGHTSRVFKLQFNDTKIVSCSQDQRIVIWDFSHGIDSRLFA
ncbi:hypothetical protein HK105_206892 [Polyrhizophydium stewartii]|uniref:F-box domain-containing protein n=1 Tax=Polyrhizophydium stewartii TaxID=2732419 RepID=A0ABR4N243_9FUNG